MVLAKKTPMEWNSWNTFGANIDHELICQTADVMAKEGYLEAGYDTLVIDDGWQAYGCSADRHLLVDEKRFPYGMKAVADYVHSKGLPLVRTWNFTPARTKCLYAVKRWARTAQSGLPTISTRIS